jgi:hypothetical protein
MRWLGCRPFRREVFTERPIDGVGIGKDLVQIWIDENDVRAFAVTLRVLATDTRLDQLLGVLVSERVLVTVHMLSAPAGSSVLLK